MTNWIYNDEPYNPLYENIEDAGFIYLITNKINGMMYVGRKRFHKKRRLKALKGKKNRRIQITESDWRTYQSSSIGVKEAIKEFGEESFVFEILSFHINYTELNYQETKLQFNWDVLERRNEAGERIFYNRNIMTKFYPSELHWESRLLLTEKFKKFNR